MARESEPSCAQGHFGPDEPWASLREPRRCCQRRKVFRTSRDAGAEWQICAAGEGGAAKTQEKVKRRYVPVKPDFGLRKANRVLILSPHCRFRESEILPGL